MLSAVIPPNSCFSHATCPLSMFTAVRALSVATRSAPDGVTCCHRMRAFRLTLQAICAAPGADAAWPCATLVIAHSDASRPTRQSTRVDGENMELSPLLGRGIVPCSAMTTRRARYEQTCTASPRDCPLVYGTSIDSRHAHGTKYCTSKSVHETRHAPRGLLGYRSGPPLS